MKTTMAKPLEVERKWYVVDATDQIVGRLATNVAAVLRGKHKPTFTPNVDTGDYVIIVNADKVRLTGNKENKKTYRYHTGFPGGIREIPYAELLEKHPERILEKAIKGMLPHNKLGRQMYKKLKVYAGPEHAHAAQMPEELKFD
ncbi:50S ribosomal protein L13 [Kallipyga gabonensis]|uniref:50S ribosomal protein L13 n=1 Tax=Kallipyga gabonensis TaxID=1686287 RepID=UPI0006B61B00|nr:50S ribosomal protein L13 [Kallipyga gabonensis]